MVKKIVYAGLINVSLLMLSSSVVNAKMKLGKTVAASGALTVASKAFDKKGEKYTELMQKFSDEDLVTLLKSEGYGGASIRREGVVVIKIDGRSHVMYNSKRGGLQMYYGLGGAVLSYKDVNQWNHTKKYSRAYLDSDKDLGLESDLQAYGGITRGQVLEFFDTFISSVNLFRKFVIEHDKS